MLSTFLVVIHRVQVAEQVNQAALSSCADHGIVSAPEVADQRSLEFLHEELPQRRFSPRAVDHVVRHVVVGEGPQPMGLARHPPRSLVGMQHGRPQGFRLDLLVPREEGFLQATPHVQQTARGELHLNVVVEDLDNLREGVAQPVVHPGGHRAGAVAQRRSRQGVGNLGFDQLLAPRAPIAMDRVLGDDRSDPFGNVLDIARAGLLAALQSALAVRATGQPMRASLVDTCWWRPTMALVSRLGSRLLSQALGRRFLIGRDHGRRRGWRWDWPLQSAQFSCHCHEGQDHGFFPLAVNLTGLLLGQRGPKDFVEIHGRAWSAHAYLYAHTLS